jgi:inward rectifier potassium channel
VSDRSKRNANNDFDVRTIGRRQSRYADAFHRVLLMAWWRFFGLAAMGFVASNAIFGLLYAAQEGSLTGARPGSFADAFFFSVQTMGTIGYGSYAPATLYANILVMIEALVGLLGFALVTGLTFAKFARPTARILFSDKMVIAYRDGERHLMFRAANARHNTVVEAQARMIVLADYVTREGEQLRVPRVLRLVRDTNPFFRLTWTISHPIDETSPFFEPDAIDRLRRKNALVLVTLTGLDETIAQPVHARHTYELDDIYVAHRFKDVISVEPDGTRVIDYRWFHDVAPESD